MLRIDSIRTARLRQSTRRHILSRRIHRHRTADRSSTTRTRKQLNRPVRLRTINRHRNSRRIIIPRTTTRTLQRQSRRRRSRRIRNTPTTRHQHRPRHTPHHHRHPHNQRTRPAQKHTTKKHSKIRILHIPNITHMVRTPANQTHTTIYTHHNTTPPTPHNPLIHKPPHPKKSTPIH